MIYQYQSSLQAIQRLQQIPSGTTKLCFYHHPCNDGKIAAAVYLREGYIVAPINYGKEVMPSWVDCPNVREVTFVDFCPTRETLDSIPVGIEVNIYDHHVTQMSRMSEFEASGRCKTVEYSNTRSGAGLAWRLFHPNSPAPWWVRYAEDYDLWTHELPHSFAVNEAFSLWELDDPFFQDWLYSNQDQTIQTGTSLLAQANKLRQELVKSAKILHTEEFGDVAFVHCPNKGLTSNLIGFVQLAQRNVRLVISAHSFADPFSSKITFSARSTDGSARVLAKRFPGGGGHDNAAGFTAAPSDLFLQLGYDLDEVETKARPVVPG